MRKLGILSMIIAVLFIAPTVSQAQEQEESKKLGISLDAIYVSKWIFNGREIWSEDGGFYEAINLDLWGTGFKTSVTHRSSTGDRRVNQQRLDYMISYSGSILDDTSYKMKYTVSYMYKDWYDKLANAAGKSKNCETWTLKYSLPSLLGSTGLVPYGITNYTEPAHKDDGFGGHWSGCVHRFGLGYDLDVNDLQNPLHLSSDIAYNDGFWAADHDWSFVTCGVSTKLKLGDNITFAPAIYYQISMDDSVCDHDVTYCALSVKYTF